MSLQIYETESDVLGRSVSARVFYWYSPRSYGAREAGVPMEPDEGPTIEIDRVELFLRGQWIQVEASDETYEQFAEEIFDRYTH